LLDTIPQLHFSRARSLRKLRVCETREADDIGQRALILKNH